MKPRAHQQEVINDDRPKTGLWWGAGSGKTYTALSLAQGKTLIICPKTIKDEGTWQRNLQQSGLKRNITVVSKEEFRRDWDILPYFDTVIGDELHTLCGVTPNTRQRKRVIIPKTSQLFEALDNYLHKHKPKRFYGLSATIMKSPMTVWGAAKLLGHYWDFFEFRTKFYSRLNMPGREVYMAKSDPDTKDRLGRLVRSIGYVGRLSDWMDVPEQTHITKRVPLTGAQVTALKTLPMDFPEPLVLVGKRHQVEQGILSGDEFNKAQTFPSGKADAILDLLEQYPKVLVFAKYTLQIEQLRDTLKDAGHTVYTLTGATKDRGTLMKEAEKATHCVVIAQSSISAGYELPSFRCTVFASESWSVTDHEQGIGRTLRMNRLEKNLYVYLVAGEIDLSVRASIENKKDFSERLFLNL